MPAEIEIQTAAEQSYPVPADVEAGAVERGWKAGWTITLVREEGKLGHYLGYLGDGRGVIEDEDEALAEALRQAEAENVVRVLLREISAYDREQIAAEAAFEARHG